MDKPKRKRRQQEVIGRNQILDYMNALRPSVSIHTVDTTTLDYEWWDKFRYGMQPGYEIASRLVAPIAKIRTVWALGDGVEFRLRANLDLERITYTNDQLKEWSASIRSTLATLVKDLQELADQYVIVNLDGSISIPSPDTVTVQRDILDYRHVLSVTVTNRLKDVEIQDIYYPDRREIIIKNITDKEITTRYGVIAAKQTEAFIFDNPLGVIPVACFHNRRSSNETNGRVEYAGDMLILSRYDDLSTKTIDAAALMGTPIPTWEGVDVESEKTALETSTGGFVPDENGEYIAEKAVQVDLNGGMFTSGSFSFKSPGNGFTGDIRDTLKLIFLLILEEHGIPESIWGGEMGQARATSVEQMKTFYAMIEGFRLSLEGMFEPEKGRIEGMVGLASLWLRMKALTDRRLVVDAIAARWPTLAQSDERLMFEKTKWAVESGMMSDATGLDQLGLVEDAEGEVERARAEAEERNLANQDPFDAAMNADAQADDTPDPAQDPAIEDEAA